MQPAPEPQLGVDGCPGGWRTEAAIKEVINDPDSFKYVGCNYLPRFTYQGKLCWVAGIVFGAKNEFGGYVKALANVYMTAGDPVEVLGVEIKQAGQASQ
jgi:hypothetical protein